ncbi:fructosamine kinase family protein, partial [Candidatus Bathyarchaeota archaeon]|nr:fructosamine kinase family protein [Candidatus Bathyarchaeota archaeon]
MKMVIPENAAQPLAWGPLDGSPSHAFYLCEFHDLEDHTARYSTKSDSTAPALPLDALSTHTNIINAHLEIQKPAAPAVASILARMHRTSASPTGKFGFPVPTFKGYDVRMDNEWCDKWEDWFARQFRMDVHFWQSVRGPDPEMDELLEV